MNLRKTVPGFFLASAAALLALRVPLPPVHTVLAAPTSVITLSEPTDRPSEQYQGSFFETSLSGMLMRLNVKVYPEDKVFAFPDPTLGIGSQIHIYRAQAVLITDGDNQKMVRTWAKTVADFATEQNLDLGEKDITAPARDTSIPIQSAIVTVDVTRVAETDVVKSLTLDHDVQYQDDSTKDQGTTSVKVAGSDGRKDITHHIIRHNGAIVSDVVTKSEVITEPVTQIIIRGTKPVITGACKYKDTVLAAAAQNGVDPNALCYRMIAESNGNPNSDGGLYKGLFQYDPGLWASVSILAGYPGASIWDATAQINVTAWAWAHKYRSRWPIP
jgi:hypothetical protein